MIQNYLNVWKLGRCIKKATVGVAFFVSQILNLPETNLGMTSSAKA